MRQSGASDGASATTTTVTSRDATLQAFMVLKKIPRYCRCELTLSDGHKWLVRVECVLS